DAAQGHALGRGDVGVGSRARQGSPPGHEGAGGGRHDHGGRHPRALVRAERRKPHFLPGPWSGRRGGITGEDLRGARRGADAALSGGSLVSPVFLQVAPYTFRWNVLVPYLPAFARALLITFEVSIV